MLENVWFVAAIWMQNKIIDQAQYTILVTVVILSAIVPTIIAQQFFQPTEKTMHAWGRLYSRRFNGKITVQSSRAEG